MLGSDLGVGAQITGSLDQHSTSYAQESESVPEYTRVGSSVRILKPDEVIGRDSRATRKIGVGHHIAPVSSNGETRNTDWSGEPFPSRHEASC